MQPDIDNIRNIWELYGLKKNPFDTSPLLVLGGTIPLDSFVGRKEEIKRLNKILGSKGGSRTVVFGDIGVGKTTFVNVVRHKAFMSGYFTPIKEIAVQENWEPSDFVLNTISAIFSTLKLLKEKPISDSLFKKLQQLFELGISNTSLGLEIAGFGGNYSKEKNEPMHLTITSLHELFELVINEIIEKTNNEIIIHYNNLELLHENKLRYLFNNLRDFFQIKGVHFIFVGNLTVRSSLQSIPRFSSILTDTPFCINNLTYEETTEVMNKRFEALRISKEYNITIPFTEDALKKLYDLMNGNIRSILNSLHTAVIEITNETPVLLNANDLSRTLKSVLEKRYISKLSDRQKEVLFEIASHEEMTNKGISDKLKIKRSNVSIYIKDLTNEGLVYLRRKNGKDKFWSARPHIRWHLLTESNTQQQILRF